MILCTVFLIVIVRSTGAVEDAKGEALASQSTAVMDQAFFDALSAVQKVSESEWLHDQFISYCLSGEPLTSIQKNDAVISLSRIVAEQSTYISRIALAYFFSSPAAGAAQDLRILSSGCIRTLS